MSLSFLKTLLPVPYAKDLGVTFDRYLTFDNHVGDVVSSCMLKLCQINRVKHCFDCDTLIKIITTLVLSKLYYCSSIWCNTSIGNIKKLKAVQNLLSQTPGNLIILHLLLAKLVGCPSRNISNIGILLCPISV